MQRNMTETAAESVCQSSTRMEHVLLLNKDFSTQEKLKTCCKPHYKMRRVKNKGAITVLYSIKLPGDECITSSCDFCCQ